MDAKTMATANLGDPVALTQALVATPSVNPILESQGSGEEEVAHLTAGWLERWGLRPSVEEVAPGRFNVLATTGNVAGKGPTLLLNGHLDTVGVAEMTDPFSAFNDGARIWGRGSADMKSGNACILAVAAALSQEDLAGTLMVAFTADEEHASLGMESYINSGQADADFAIVCEPTSLNVMPAHKGFAWFDIEVVGHAAHGSRPEVGIDAIAKMGQVLLALSQEEQRLRSETHHPLLGPGSIHAGLISGGTAPSVYPGGCQLTLERRTLPGEGLAAITAELQRMLDAVQVADPDLKAVLQAGLFRAGTEVSATEPPVLSLIQACKREGVGGLVEGMSAWVDACYLNQAGIPALCFGPGSIAQAHTIDEWVSVDEIRYATRILTNFSMCYLATE